MTSLEEWIAKTEGSIEALTRAFGALAASHQAPDEVLGLLRSMATSAAKVEADSPGQKAYKSGIAEAISRLTDAVTLARQARDSETRAKH